MLQPHVCIAKLKMRFDADIQCERNPMKIILTAAGYRLALVVGLTVTVAGWSGAGLAADWELHEKSSDRKPAATDGIGAKGGTSRTGVADKLHFLIENRVRNFRTRIHFRNLAQPGKALLAIAKTQPVQVIPASHIESVTVRILARPSLGARHKTEQMYAEATVVITDHSGVGVPGATVKGSFTGNLLRRSQSVSGTTDSSGTVGFVLSKSVGWDGSSPLRFTFCVDHVDASPSWDGVGACDTRIY